MWPFLLAVTIGKPMQKAVLERVVWVRTLPITGVPMVPPAPNVGATEYTTPRTNPFGWVPSEGAIQ